MRRLPFNPERLLAFFMTKENAGSLAGDLEERFQEVFLGKGSIWATAWYLAELTCSLLSLMRSSIRQWLLGERSDVSLHRSASDQFRGASPQEFESFVANSLERMGYNVQLTAQTTRKDGGIDIIAMPKMMNVGTFVLAVQVKHHAGEQKTGRDVIDRLASWNGPFNLGMVVTNTGFTTDAIRAAGQGRNRHFLRLRDFNDLKRWHQDQYGESGD